MFCYQCEGVAKGTGCTVQGVCGKDPETAALQDLLVHAAKGLSSHAHKLRLEGKTTSELDHFILETLFTTVTNVNFDPKRLQQLLSQASKLADSLGSKSWNYSHNLSELVEEGKKVGIEAIKDNLGDDLTGLGELLLYGLKGTAAYAHHAKILGQEDDSVYAFIHKALAALAEGNNSVDDLLSMNLKCGEINLRVMQILDSSHTNTYGHQVPTSVRTTPIKGKAILVSGHDMKDLEMLLQQTEGRGINIYTHGEMLTAHAYPKLAKYKHLVGNYGGAWQDQRKEFDAFPGSILMTTNCIQKPKDSYKNRIFTTGLVAWPEVYHLENDNFRPLIEMAIASDGFKEDAEDKYVKIGFGHNAVMNVADAVIDAVRAGKIKHFFLIGGCDGAKPGRNYYTELAEKVPQDSVILTLACGKYRFNKMDFGDIGGIPRLLDMGQCNDAYSAIQVAVALSKAFDCSVNELPLSLVLSWYEQKAVCILLTLLSLDIKNIRLGPSLPAFVTPAVLSVLVEKFNVMPTTTADEDLKTILG